MIHYGKSPNEDKLIIEVSADEVGEVYDVLCSAGLLQRRTFHGLKAYIDEHFKADMESYRRRMTAQIPAGREGGQSC